MFGPTNAVGGAVDNGAVWENEPTVSLSSMNLHYFYY
jgi:hypothetical protein